MASEILVQQVLEKTKLEQMIEKAKLLSESILKDDRLENYNLLASKLFEISEIDDIFVYDKRENDDIQAEILKIELAEKTFGQLWIQIDKKSGEIWIKVIYCEGLKEKRESYIVQRSEEGYAKFHLSDGKSDIILEPMLANSEFIEYLVTAILERIVEFKK